MNQQKIIYTKRDRVRFYFCLLQYENKKWDNHLHAHEYLKRCMEVIEDTYGPEIDKIFLDSFKHFTPLKEYSLYYVTTRNQVILLHENGSYAMYNKREKFRKVEKDLFFYYQEGKCRIQMENLSGESVWVDFEKVNRRKIQKLKEKKLAAA